MKKALPFVLAAMMGCIGEYDEPLHPDGGQGQDGSGGGNGSGGSAVATGGTASGGSAVATGGTASGGAVATGGEVGSGGRPGSGGAQASGGMVGSGGAVGSGGRAAGGSVGSGGQASGGVMGGGGRTGIGGAGTGGDGGRGTGGSAGGRSGGSAGGRSGGAGATGSGGTGAGGSTATVCTSGKMWMNGNGTDMRPGNDCKGCHSFSISGTVYPTAHEPNNCNGTAAGGIKVVLTGADGSTVTLTPSATSGNFYSNTAIKTPYTAKITNSSGATRMMTASQTTANCNSCHTPTGANGAPGRIYAP